MEQEDGKTGRFEDCSEAVIGACIRLDFVVANQLVVEITSVDRQQSSVDSVPNLPVFPSSCKSLHPSGERPKM